MSLELTLALMAVGALVFAFAAWRTKHPADPAKGPRLIPWTLIAVTCGLLLILLAAHIFNLYGIETGRGRGRF
tara:strand:+ start:110 stop:328 length:219 start_codon:yes stop_codon:yes gene_type:complete